MHTQKATRSHSFSYGHFDIGLHFPQLLPHPLRQSFHGMLGSTIEVGEWRLPHSMSRQARGTTKKTVRTSNLANVTLATAATSMQPADVNDVALVCPSFLHLGHVLPCHNTESQHVDLQWIESAESFAENWCAMMLSLRQQPDTTLPTCTST